MSFNHPLNLIQRVSVLLLTETGPLCVQFGAAGLNWTVPLGRRDGVVSSAAEANSNLPPPFATFQQLVTSFSNKGFTTREMVVLSGP